MFQVSYTNRSGCLIVQHTGTLTQALQFLDVSKGRVKVVIPKSAPPLFGEMHNPDFVVAEIKAGLRAYTLLYR